MSMTFEMTLGEFFLLLALLIAGPICGYVYGRMTGR